MIDSRLEMMFLLIFQTIEYGWEVTIYYNRDEAFQQKAHMEGQPWVKEVHVRETTFEALLNMR